jgi:hypothetical protein
VNMGVREPQASASVNAINWLRVRCMGGVGGPTGSRAHR